MKQIRTAFFLIVIATLFTSCLHMKPKAGNSCASSAGGCGNAASGSHTAPPAGHSCASSAGGCGNAASGSHTAPPASPMPAPAQRPEANMGAPDEPTTGNKKNVRIEYCIDCYGTKGRELATELNNKFPNVKATAVEAVDANGNKETGVFRVYVDDVQIHLTQDRSGQWPANEAIVTLIQERIK